ncbi:MAG: DUF4342 domain-containing protein [Patescibacteria group bacterium]|nr:DUF4342 domain-containing protein [Patescibacteria group bacterium]
MNSDTFEVKGEELLAKVKEIIKEGNVRQISIVSKEGKTLIVLPLTLGVVGALLAPALAAVGAVAALVSECSIKVERKE